ncbi:MAG: aminopeptidase [Lachnospiraceae bacterium]|nr:aminopeptidase [Lachnospiraceae bacterium]
MWEQKNDEIQERYELSMERVRAMKSETSVAAPFYDYFRKTAEFIEKIGRVAKQAGEDAFAHADLDRLKRLNQELYCDVAGNAYAESYACPETAAERLGEGYGQLLSFLYTEIRGMIVWAYEQRYTDLTVVTELFIEIYNAFEEGTPELSSLKEMVYWYVSDYCDIWIPYRVREQLDPGMSFARDIICGADLDDVRYLYRFGEYITENELEMSRFLAGLPQKEIDSMAFTFTEGYRMGFVNAGIDLSKKKTVNIRYSLGFERIVRAAVAQFAERGLESIIYREARHSVNRRPQGNAGYQSTAFSKQYLFDHREDSALYLDSRLVERRLSLLKAAYEECKELAAVHAGPAVMEIFGEQPFLPKNSKAALKLSRKQQELNVRYNSGSGQIVNTYIPGDERSFTIIAYPIPEIGEKFPEIFAETVKLNTLDYHLYQKLQQKLIDALDQGESVSIRGKNGNRTDLTVCLGTLSNPEKETLFENCVADVNIPVGEVFTSPRLTGTNGILHVSEVYLNELKYLDLELRFENGRVTDYSCKNFDSEEENRSYIKSNILFNHETLPLGEFAIGTNTTAYMMAKKYRIGAKLPILIAEKMGPHFAVGDTCYSWSEETSTYNSDGKRITAKDNECSILRKEDVSKAYFNCHTDITIPYDELGYIRVNRRDSSSCSIIENGRFVLPGTEELNRPFDE